MFNNYRRWLGYLLFLLIINISPLYAQIESEIILTGELRASLSFSWSVDSQRFAVLSDTELDGTIRPHDDPIWISYDIPTQQLTSSETWPLQPALSAAELNVFQPAVSYDGDLSNIFMSPDERYIVYARVGADGVEYVTLGDRATLTYQVTDIRAGGFGDTPQDAFVQWPTVGQGFVLATSALMAQGPSFYYYASGYSPDITQLSLTEFGLLQDSPDDLVGVTNVYQLSLDGRYILANARNIQGENRRSLPVLIDTQDLTNFMLLDDLDGVEVGRLHHLSGTRLLATPRSSVPFIYDWATGESMPLTLASGTVLEGSGYQSPDGTYVALFKVLDSDTDQLTLVDMRAEIQATLARLEQSD